MRQALFATAASGLLLLFIGIHNAWDAVTYHVFVNRPEQKEAEQMETAANAQEPPTAQ